MDELGGAAWTQASEDLIHPEDWIAINKHTHTHSRLFKRCFSKNETYSVIEFVSVPLSCRVIAFSSRSIVPEVESKLLYIVYRRLRRFGKE
jgi:hypothetical protein